jgi:hypothetical protein
MLYSRVYMCYHTIYALLFLVPVSSIEAFVVCQGYCKPSGFSPAMLSPLLDHQYAVEEEQTEPSNEPSTEPLGPGELAVRFVACGDLSGFDEHDDAADAQQGSSKQSEDISNSSVSGVSSSSTEVAAQAGTLLHTP